MQKSIINGITVLTADDGMKLTNGEAVGATVCLGVKDSADNWQEVTEAEAEAMLAQTQEEATEADYQAALSEFGVTL